MKVLLKEPGKPYVFVEIENTLEAMQKTVGGYIETLMLRNGLVLVCDEEGRLKNKDWNAIVRTPSSEQCIDGTFFVCDVAGEDFAGLSDDLTIEQLQSAISLVEFSDGMVK